MREFKKPVKRTKMGQRKITYIGSATGEKESVEPGFPSKKKKTGKPASVWKDKRKKNPSVPIASASKDWNNEGSTWNTEESLPASKRSVRRRRLFSPRKKKTRGLRKGSNSGKGKWSLLIWIGLFAVLLPAFLLINAKAPTGVVEWIRGYVASMGSGSYPVKVSGSHLEFIALRGGQPVALSEGTISLWNESGKEVFQRMHGCSAPALSASDNRLLVYNRGDPAYRLENPDRTLYTGKTDQSIIAGAIANNGSYGFATDSVGYASQLEIYNKSYQLKYRWYSAQVKLGCMALSPVGDRAAVMGLDASEGNLQSVLYVLDTSSEDATPIFQESYLDSLAFSVQFKGRDEVTVISQQEVITCHIGEKSSDIVSFDGDTLKAYDDSSQSGTVLCLAVRNDSLNNRILFLDGNGKKQGEFSVAFTVRSVAKSGRYVYVLTDHMLYRYNVDGEEVNHWELDRDGLMVRANGSTAYVMFADEVGQYRP